MEDEAEVYDGVRAQFPLSFGKQTKSQTPLEVIHNTTRRNSESSTDNNKTNQLPFISSSSKAWLTNLRKSPNPNSRQPIGPPNLGHASEKSHSENLSYESGKTPVETTITTENSILEDDDGGQMVGPPPPPPSSNLDVDDDDEGDGEMIGPPPPPSNMEEEDEDEDSDFEPEDLYRIPLSNEIVLKGHSKVFYLPQFKF